MKQPVYVIDTSYLVEYYKIGKHQNEANYQEIKNRFEIAIKNKYRLFVPVPVIFEIANHIAHVADGNQRRQLAQRFNQDIQNSFEKDTPFILIPCKDFETISQLVNNLIKFTEQYAIQGLGLTDTSVYLQAERLYHEYKKFKNYVIHIWTLDADLKSKEPDKEENPFYEHKAKK